LIAAIHSRFTRQATRQSAAPAATRRDGTARSARITGASGAKSCGARGTVFASAMSNAGVASSGLASSNSFQASGPASRATSPPMERRRVNASAAVQAMPPARSTAAIDGTTAWASSYTRSTASAATSRAQPSLLRKWSRTAASTACASAGLARRCTTTAARSFAPPEISRVIKFA
jgi:hypothetical protein